MIGCKAVRLVLTQYVQFLIRRINGKIHWSRLAFGACVEHCVLHPLARTRLLCLWWISSATAFLEEWVVCSWRAIMHWFLMRACTSRTVYLARTRNQLRKSPDSSPCFAWIFRTSYFEQGRATPVSAIWQGTAFVYLLSQWSPESTHELFHPHPELGHSENVHDGVH